MVHFVTLNINCAERSGRAEVLASATTDALVIVYSRYFHRTVWAFVINHLDGSRGAMASAVAATDTVGQNYTVFLNPHGMTGMDGGFFLTGYGLDGTSRAYLAAPCAFRTAIAALKRHDGLHKFHKVGGGTQHIVRTTRNAKLASRAMLFKMARRHRTRRRYRCLAFRGFLVLDGRQTAIHFHLGLGEGRCCACYCCANEESAAFRINGFGFRWSFFGGVMQRVELAFV